MVGGSGWGWGGRKADECARVDVVPQSNAEPEPEPESACRPEKYLGIESALMLCGEGGVGGGGRTGS